MDYRLNDELICIELFSNSDRVIDEGDVYRVMYVDFVILYIKEIAKNKSVICYGIIPVTIDKIDKYFKCKRIERKHKLDKLNDITK